MGGSKTNAVGYIRCKTKRKLPLGCGHIEPTVSHYITRTLYQTQQDETFTSIIHIHLLEDARFLFVDVFVLAW